MMAPPFPASLYFLICLYLPKTAIPATPLSHPSLQDTPTHIIDTLPTHPCSLSLHITDWDTKKSSSMSSQPERNQFKRKAKEGEVDGEIEEFFKIGEEKETSPEIALLVETVIAQLEVAADEDAELNRQDKPAIIKLRNLSLLTDIIPRKHLQQELLDRGVLCALRRWLEPLPNGSIPNINVRAAVLKCLNDLTIPLEDSHQREFLSKSGIGKAIMFYYRYDEETAANRKLAKELVDKWSRAIFNISTSYEDVKNYEEKTSFGAPPVKKAMKNAAAWASLNDGLPELSLGRGSGPSSSEQYVSRPKPMSMIQKQYVLGLNKWRRVSPMQS